MRKFADGAWLGIQLVLVLEVEVEVPPARAPDEKAVESPKRVRTPIA